MRPNCNLSKGRVAVVFTRAQAKLVRDLTATYLDACCENAAVGEKGAADARIARAVLRALRLGVSV